MGPLHHLYLSPVKFASQADYKAKPQEGNTYFGIFSGNLQNQLRKMSSCNGTTVVTVVDEAPSEIISRTSKSSGMCHDFHQLMVVSSPMLQKSHSFQVGSFELFIKRKRKIGYLLGKILIPDDGDPKFETWEDENFMIMFWLLYFMQPEIRKPLLFLSMAKDPFSMLFSCRR
ncbi:hypothetical protein CK203_021079 [Vitis vinifera]|uniref:Uncharacterized protein n=1 Tax=Vitis vinifera TaxID=29760 RepID=A0A438JWL3_VITVI|nr:hypothetical protein CK203_021079 [Vitis vinifera]